ncbi:MAG: leucyl/phenylalanyl-tRNA--protein transferase [Alphaproteobacteria bacterium]|nr:leucyl/phenylalanyl-tRNA--protein transferase [Alphaproteobacteria bacterium]MCB9928666.1 leucyl/phenylalanyl-tRNA--protein transferase [Alphaproteobacteria bacterium]
MTVLTPTLVLRAYAMGVFPMAESHDAETLYWVDPDRRGVLPLDAIHVPRRLKRTVRQGRFRVRCDTDFEGVIDGCAEATPDRRDTWINAEVRSLFRALYDMGVVHTVECWQDDALVGGLYGLRLGGAFFGESMFSRVRDASKVALVHLAARLCDGGFTLLDTQFITDHLARFGTVEIPRDDYRDQLERALTVRADFRADLPQAALEAFLDRCI